ncbi:MAG TPA: AsmA-like C-terminal region-containing protein [Burkholderiales bacterium]|nr:AsmA-like C-terminal region-containing protein [Burkholderiales bacterium]
MPRRVPAAKILAALAALGVLALGAIALIGIGIDAQRWREPVAAALSRALGRAVRLDGPARLTLSLRPALRVGDVRIANPPGFDSPDFARIGELHVAMDLLPLLQNEIRVSEVRGRDVAVRLTRAGDGRGNWTFVGGAQDGPSTRRRVGVHRVVLETLLIEQTDGGATRRFELAELSAEALPGEPVRVALRGRPDGPATATAQATGAPLSGLGAAEPWPFEFQVLLPGTVVNGSGTLSGPLDRPAVRIAFGAGTGNLREAGRLLAVESPPLGAAIAGELDIARGGAALRSFNGVVGGTAFAGELALDTSGTRPKLTGRLSIPELDSRAFLERSPGAAAEEAETLAAAFEALERTGFDLQRLKLLDADLQLSVAHWAGVPGDVRDLGTRLRIDAGKLAAPLAATIAGARFEGELSADGTSAPPRLRAHLAAGEAPLGGLAELVFDAPYVAGSVRRIEVTLDARGERFGDLARDLEGRIGVEGAGLTYGNFAGGRPVAMRLDAAEVIQPRGRTIAATLHGSLRGKRFAGTFRAGTVEQILRERRTPFAFDGTSASVRARLSGTLAEPTSTTGPEIAVDLTAPRASELAPWLGFSSRSDARVALKGIVQVQQRHASLTGASLRAGRTSIAGAVTWQTIGDRALVTADLLAEVLAPAELRGLATTKAAQRATVLEIPILPESLDFADSDVQLRVKRVDGLPLEIADVVFQGRMRRGELTASPLSLRVEGNALAGALALDARGDAPEASLWAAGEGIDLGAVLRRLRVARDVDSRIGALRFYADIRERLLGDALEQSSFVATFESGSLDFRDANTGAALRLSIDAGEVRADAGAPVTAALKGTAGAVPVVLKAQAGRLRELVEPGGRLPFSVSAEMPAAKLAVSGTAVPQRDPDVALSLTLNGERLDGLDTLLETSLPPWGPYALTARLRFAKRGYEVSAMRLALGESVLTGSGSLDTTPTPPKFDAALAAERIQLDDFPLGDWSPFEQPDRGGAPRTVETTRRAVADSARRAHAIFSRDLLRRGDGKVDVAVKQVGSGADDLGRGRFAASVANGRATIGPIEVDSPAGSARGTLVYEPRERDVLVEARVNVDRFDYGTFARRLRAGTDIDGAFSLDLHLAATAPRLSAALATGSGRFDFALWPKRLQARVFDLWSANLLFRLLPLIDVSASPMNCMVGRFDLEHGTLRSRRLVIDTVNTRTEGSGTADFATSEVSLRFVPRPKVPQFFSLATPIEVSGTFEDYRFGVRPADAFGTAARWVASPVVVPIQRLVGERIPADGRDVCANPGR